MRVLVTAGGTRAYLDEVRWIGNFSTGRFGAAIAMAALKRGATVVHLHAEDAVLPLQRTIDFTGDWQTDLRACEQTGRELERHRSRYRAVPFASLSQYADRLEQLLRSEPFDIAFLVAAVSDYAPPPTTGKISSEQDELVVRLVRTPKLIARVKEWAPQIFLVGFKLLAGVSESELIETARRSGAGYRSDVTVANDLRLLRAGHHTIHLVREGQPTETYSQPDGPADRLVERVFAWQAERGAG